MKYKMQDFEKIVNGEATIDEMSKHYGVSKQVFINQMNRHGYFCKKTKLKITTPLKTKIVYSYSACANELKVSETTIRNHLKGIKVKVFDELGIKVEIIK